MPHKYVATLLSLSYPYKRIARLNKIPNIDNRNPSRKYFKTMRMVTNNAKTERGISVVNLRVIIRASRKSSMRNILRRIEVGDIIYSIDQWENYHNLANSSRVFCGMLNISNNITKPMRHFFYRLIVKFRASANATINAIGRRICLNPKGMNKSRADFDFPSIFVKSGTVFTNLKPTETNWSNFSTKEFE